MTTGRWASAWFILLAVAVLGPLSLPGYVFLLDAPTGPNPPTPEFFPVPSEGLFTVGAPTSAFVRLIHMVVTNAAPQVMNKLLIGLVIFLAGLGLFRLARDLFLVPTLSAVAGGTLYAINPFVYERLVSGQLLFLLGYALLPWVIRLVACLVESARWQDAVVVSLGVGVLSMVSIHMGAMTLVGALIGVSFTRRGWTIRLAFAGFLILTFLIWNLYWLIPSIVGNEGSLVGEGDLATFAPRPRSAAVLSHLLLLHGFWRQEFTTPLQAYPVLFLALFATVLSLVYVGLRRCLAVPLVSRLSACVASAALVGIVLGMGTSFPPVAALNRFLFDWFPGYRIFREPHKWIALVALAYALFFAAGIADLSRRWSAHRLGARFLPITGILVLLVASSVMLGGLGGQVRRSEYPADWYRVTDLLKGKEGTLLFLPWHQFHVFSFSDGRILSNPAEYFFPVRVLSSEADTPEHGGATGVPSPVDAHVRRLVKTTEVRELGTNLAALGVRFVALAHVGEDDSYGFLESQKDLDPLYRGQDLTVYENSAWRGEVYALSCSSCLRRLPDSGSSGLLSPDTSGQVWFFGAAWRLVERLGIWPTIELAKATTIGTDRLCSDGWYLGTTGAECYEDMAAAFHGVRDNAGRLWRPFSVIQASSLVLSTALGWTLVMLARFRRVERE